MLVAFSSSFLCVWNQMSWRTLLTIVLARDFCMYSFDGSTGCQNLCGCGAISQKIIQIFSLNFLGFGSDTTEKQIITNLNSSSSKSYSCIVLSDSEVTFFVEENDATFCLFLCCVLLIDREP